MQLLARNLHFFVKYAAQGTYFAAARHKKAAAGSPAGVRAHTCKKIILGGGRKND